MKVFLSLISLLYATSGFSGAYWATAHSRANCAGFNESITWWLAHHHWWQVKSYHTSPRGPAHLLNTGMNYTWRAAAYHMREAYQGDGWAVKGLHFYRGTNGQTIFDVQTIATDCSIYDGWWDQ